MFPNLEVNNKLCKPIIPNTLEEIKKKKKNTIQKIYRQPIVCNGRYKAKSIQLNECYFTFNPCMEHWVVAKRIINYL